MNSRFNQAINIQKRKTQERNPLIAGSLGITMGGRQVVEVADRPSYVYVQVRSSTAEVIEAFNQAVSPVYGLPVFIQWQGNRYVVTERDTMRYSNWVDYSAYLPRHASTHEFDGSAGDVVFVAQEQFMPLLPTPSGSIGARTLIINDYLLMTTTGTFLYFPSQATANLTAWNPTSPTGAIMVLVSLDAQNGSLVYTVGSGTVFNNQLTGTADVAQYIPAVSDTSRYLPLVAVRLITGTVQLTWNNMYDARPVFGVTRSVGGGGGGGTPVNSSGLAVLNNGVLENYANQLNLLGSSFILSHSGTEAQLNIQGGGGGGSSGSLLLDTSNGPLYGPLVVYQKNPNTINQYFDYSTIVGYLSGTSNVHFGAAVEAVNFSTGASSYGVYVDDEGSSQGLFVGGLGKMDNPLAYFSHNIDNNRAGGQYFSNIFQFIRWGGGITPVKYLGAGIYLDERSPDNVHAPSLEIDANSVGKTLLFPTSSGTYLHPFAGDWFPTTAPYFFDTHRSIPTGAPLFVVLNNTSAKFWIDSSGMVVSRGGYDTTYGDYRINGVPHTHGSSSVDTIGIAALNEGVAVGTGTYVNFRSGPPNAFSVTLSGTMLDVYVTGVAGPQGPAGAGNPGMMAWDEGVPLGTGTVLNFVGAGVQATVSGSVIQVNVSGSSGGRILISQLELDSTPTGSFINIPSIYQALELHFVLRTTTGATTAANGLIHFNKDATAANYAFIDSRSNSAGFTRDNGTDGAFAPSMIPAAGNELGEFCVGRMMIDGYARGASMKVANSVMGAVVGATNIMNTNTSSVVWKSKNAINQIDIMPSANGTWVSGSYVALYGLP